MSLNAQIESLQRAAMIAPQDAGPQFELADVLLGAGRPSEAIPWYRSALVLTPANGPGYANLGAALRASGDASSAIECVNRALALGCDHPAVHNILGNALSENGDLDGAVESYRRALERDPQYAEAHNNLGIALTARGDPEAAIASYARALESKPQFAEAHLNQGLALGALRRYSEALAEFDKALSLRADLADAHNARGVALRHLERYEAAAASYEEAIRLRPSYCEAHYNLGLALLALQSLEKAVACFDRAIALQPRHSDAHFHRGLAQGRLGRYAQSLASYDVVLGFKPNDAEASWNKALVKLLLGEWAEGWALFESRFAASWLGVPSRPFPEPRWSGSEPLNGKTIFVYAEQGLGDTIQFARYATRLCSLGARVLLEVQPALKSLMETLAGGALVFAQGEEIPEFDYHCPLLSLPSAFRTEVSNVPVHVPYLWADEERSVRWGERLADAATGMKVGIAWQGNPKVETNGLQGRSVPLSAFRALANVPGVTLVSLQKGPGSEQLDQVDFRDRIVAFPEELDGEGKAFLDTVAVMKNLDVVVTSDTSIAHLAGALGIPTWVALHATPDWRWLLARNDSPWYPSVRLFRQKSDSAGDWSTLFSQIAAELRKAQERATRTRR